MYFWEQIKLVDERASGRPFFRGVDEALRAPKGRRMTITVTDFIFDTLRAERLKNSKHCFFIQLGA